MVNYPNGCHHTTVGGLALHILEGMRTLTLQKKEGDAMSIMEFVALVSFGLTCFSIGYTLGKDAKK